MKKETNNVPTAKTFKALGADSKKAKYLAGTMRRSSSDGFMPRQPIAYGYGYKDPMRKNAKGELMGGKRYEYPIHTQEDLDRVKKNGHEHRLAGQKDPGPKDSSKNKAAAVAAEKAIPKAGERRSSSDRSSHDAK